ncbi:hypothetical protein CYMTET_47721 [Cymbomonas tetramitiformis]|uniref:K Homology domain-containing protein n=1 Tax=Cymbomonas tetramitiformis TaxID=36881 RepID=A0AAE0BVJ3_9CHLO|nr:hypothetical protein CYMTET_47721 [Cymbomonas tetramitiformis]|eukprot:gene4528-5545_t
MYARYSPYTVSRKARYPEEVYHSYGDPWEHEVADAVPSEDRRHWRAQHDRYPYDAHCELSAGRYDEGYDWNRHQTYARPRKEREHVYYPRKPAVGDGVYEYEVDLPEGVSPGRVIGTNGCNLKEMQQDGVRVHVGECSVRVVTNRKQKFEIAKLRVKKLIRSVVREGGGRRNDAANASTCTSVSRDTEVSL